MSMLFIAFILAVILNVVVVVVAWKWPMRARYFALAELAALLYFVYMLFDAISYAFSGG